MKRPRLFGLILVVAAAFLLSFVAVALAVLPPGGTFVDDNGNYHEPMIEAIAAAGITNGCNTNPARYCPGDKVKRSEMATFLVRAADETGNVPSYQGYFADVPEGQWYTPYVERLFELGITSGCDTSPRRFCPEGTVLRSEMAAFLVRFVEGDTNLPTYQGIFADVPEGHWYTPYVERLFELGITSGCDVSPSRYCPGDDVLRDQMASFLARALGLSPITPPPPELPGEMSIVFVAVRQGDAAIYRGACGEVGVIDVNRYRADDVLAALDKYASRSLKWIVTSHYDADHLGGVEDLARSPGVTVGTFYDRGGDRTVKDSNTYRDYYDYTTSLGTRTPVDIGDTFTLCAGADQVTFTVISQGTDGTAVGGVAVSEENDRGLCLHVEYHDFDHATCGDINGTGSGSRTDVETPAAAVIGDVELVKINHHGSSYSSNQTWVDTLDAEVAVLSVGKNSYGHPSAVVVSRWASSGAALYQTSSTTVSTGLVDGDVVVATTGSVSFTVETSASSRNDTYPIVP